MATLGWQLVCFIAYYLTIITTTNDSQARGRDDDSSVASLRAASPAAERTARHWRCGLEATLCMHITRHERDRSAKPMMLGAGNWCLLQLV
jgi:hypothetical protein